MIISIIAALAENNVIGYKNKIPWHIKKDLKHFRDLTLGHCVIMGQKTHQSIGKALPGRTNVILSFDKDFVSPGCITVPTIEDALRMVISEKESEVFVIGGASIYRQFIGVADRLYITKINHKFRGDTFFPEIDPKKWQIKTVEKFEKSKEVPYSFEFRLYEKKNI